MLSEKIIIVLFTLKVNLSDDEGCSGYLVGVRKWLDINAV